MAMSHGEWSCEAHSSVAVIGEMLKWVKWMAKFGNVPPGIDQGDSRNSVIVGL